MKSLRLLFLLVPSAVAAQLPKLEPLPVAASLQELDFRVDPRFAVERSGCLALFDADDAVVHCIDPTTDAKRTVGKMDV